MLARGGRQHPPLGKEAQVGGEVGAVALALLAGREAGQWEVQGGGGALWWGEGGGAARCGWVAAGRRGGRAAASFPLTPLPTQPTPYHPHAHMQRTFGPLMARSALSWARAAAARVP